MTLIGGRAVSALARFFAGSNLEDDSDFDPDASVCSAQTGGDSVFSELSIDSGDLTDIYGQRIGRDGDESGDDDSAAGPDSGLRDRVSPNGDAASSSSTTMVHDQHMLHAHQPNTHYASPRPCEVQWDCFTGLADPGEGGASSEEGGCSTIFLGEAG